MNRTLIYITSQILFFFGYWGSVVSLQWFAPYLHSSGDRYTMMVYFMIVLGSFGYYLIRIFPRDNIFLGIFIAVTSLFPLTVFGFLASEPELFDTSRIIARCDKEYVYSLISRVSGKDNLYTRRLGVIFADGNFFNPDTPVSEIEITIYEQQAFDLYGSCLESAGYTVKFVDMSQ